MPTYVKAVLVTIFFMVLLADGVLLYIGVGMMLGNGVPFSWFVDTAPGQRMVGAGICAVLLGICAVIGYRRILSVKSSPMKSLWVQPVSAPRRRPSRR